MVTLPKNADSSTSQDDALNLNLPVLRIKMIMKSCPNIESVNQETLQIVAKATELFIAHLAKQSHARGESENRLDYESLSTIVASDSNFEFLMETVPKKVTWSECKEMMETKSNSVEDLI